MGFIYTEEDSVLDIVLETTEIPNCLNMHAWKYIWSWLGWYKTWMKLDNHEVNSFWVSIIWWLTCFYLVEKYGSKIIAVILFFKSAMEVQA